MASPTDTLTVNNGIIMDANPMTMAGGRLTAGTTSSATDLFLRPINSNTYYITTSIVDNNANGSVRLVKGDYAVTSNNTLVLMGNNTYTGGTVLNLGTTTLNAQLPGITTLPAGPLTLSGGTLTVNNFGGQFAGGPTTNVTMNGNATINLLGTTSIGSLAMNNYGGGCDHAHA